MSVAAMTRWSALVLLGMSLAGLASLLMYAAISGVVREADEGTGAHLWQLLMAAQVPLGAFFAITWLPRARRKAQLVLLVQAAVVLANLAVVRYLDL